MSRQVRNRATATALGGFLLGAALLMTGTASADQVDDGGRQIVFAGGGVFGLSCTSTPSAESLTVPPDGIVRVVNRTGHRAKLRLNGEAKGSLPDDGSTEVIFRRGTTAVTVDPTCVTTDQATPVQVTASPSKLAQPGPTPEPVTSATDPDVLPSDPGTPDATIDSGSAVPAPVTRPQRSSNTIARRSVPARPKQARITTRATRAATMAARSRPHGVAEPRIKTRVPARGTAKASAPVRAGVRSRDDKTLLTGVPPLDLQPVPTGTASAHSAQVSAGMAAAEPAAVMRPLPDSGSVGLLALIASVSVFGVSCGVIRALVSQRASRSIVA